MGIFSRLVPPLVSAFGLQAGMLAQCIFSQHIEPILLLNLNYEVCAAIFVPQANERYYDFCGALGYLTTTAVSLYYPALRNKYLLNTRTPLPGFSSFAPRQLLLTGCITIWTSRLGAFLLSVRYASSSTLNEFRLIT